MAATILRHLGENPVPEPVVSTPAPPSPPPSPRLRAVAPAGYWASKSKVQLGCIAALVAMALLILCALKPDSFGKSLKGLIIDPNTHALASTSGAMFCAMGAVAALGIWALLDNRENRVVDLLEDLFENKNSYQISMLVGAAAIVLVALPFILLTAQGCEPFKEGWDKFQQFLNAPTPSFQDAFPVVVVILGLGVVAAQLMSALVKDKGNELPWWDKKTESQQNALYVIGAVAIVASILIFLVAKGVEPLDKGWENFKGLITNSSPDVLHALPAIGIVMGLLGTAGVVLWNLLAHKETEEDLEIKWSGKENEWRRCVLKVTACVFILALPLIILAAKGVGKYADGWKAFIKFGSEPMVTLGMFLVGMGLFATIGAAFFPEDKSPLDIFTIKTKRQEAREVRRKEEAEAERVRNDEVFQAGRRVDEMAAAAREQQRAQSVANQKLVAGVDWGFFSGKAPAAATV